MEKNYLRSSLGLRLGIIAFLSLILLVPTVMIQSVIGEREQRRKAAVDEVSSKWGNVQTVTGPILSIPYKAEKKYEDGTVEKITRYVHLLPDSLNITGRVVPEIRYRGIYEVVLYKITFGLSGTFAPAGLNTLDVPEQDLMMEDACVSIGITDMRGIQELVRLDWNRQPILMDPGVLSKDVVASGIHALTPLKDPDLNYAFSIELNLNGSENILFVPLGIETNAMIESTWQHPSFTGSFLPDQREVGDSGFTARWNILHLNRNFPQKWVGDAYKVNDAAFGVDFIVRLDDYQKTMRTTKYAIMFIAFTFLAFFLIELLNRMAIHPIQYLLIGFSLLIFYTLLLSISEHISFNWAYLLSCIAVTGLIITYTRTILKNNRFTLIIFLILLVLYGYLFIVLQLQDYALLMGSIGLFLALAALMYITRRIDWFSILKPADGS